MIPVTEPDIPVDVFDVLRCPRCGATFDRSPAGAARDRMRCSACGHGVPIVAGVPRFVGDVPDDTARRTQASFGYEWTHFTDWRQSGRT